MKNGLPWVGLPCKQAPVRRVSQITAGRAENKMAKSEVAKGTFDKRARLQAGF